MEVPLRLHAILSSATWILLLVLTVGFLLRGARTWIRWGLLLLVGAWVGDVAVSEGPSAAVGVAGFLAALSGGSMLYATQKWKTPSRVEYEPLSPLEWPAHALEEAERFSSDFVAMGFLHAGDVRSRWGFGSEVRHDVVRRFVHPSESTLVTVAAASRPKVLGRAITSLLGDGTVVITSDRQTDYGSLPIPLIRSLQVSQLASSRELVGAHQGLVDGRVASGSSPMDTAKIMGDVRSRWIQQLIEDGRARRSGDWVTLTWRGSLQSVRQILRAFLR